MQVCMLHPRTVVLEHYELLMLVHAFITPIQHPVGYPNFLHQACTL
jgi:hypothetical protein